MCLPGTKQPVCSFLMFGVSASIDNIEKYVLAKQNHYLKNIPPPHHSVTRDMLPPFHRRAMGGSLGHLRVESQTQLFAITLYLLPMVQNPKCSFSLLFLSLSHVRPFATPWTIVHGILQARILEKPFFFQEIFPT